MVKAASVVRDLAEPGAISTGFLKQLAQIVGVDTAAIGRIVGHEFVVEAVYTPGGTITRPGGKFPLLTIFREAVRKGAFGDGEGRAGGTP